MASVGCLTTTNLLDAAGHVLATVRSAGGWSITKGLFAYNSAGELIAETNALGGVTTYSESVDANAQ
ncbi:MAG: hypothetical protein ACP5MD_12305, partial [Verrucomicrobiia bacterium]